MQSQLWLLMFVSGWRRAPRKEGVRNRELLFDKGKLKIPEKKSKSLQRLKHPGDNHPNTLPTKPSDGSTGAGKPLALPNRHCNSRETFGYKLYIDLIILRSFSK